MYFVPRLIGVGTYALFLGIFYTIIFHHEARTARRALNAYIVVLCAMAFFFVPNPGADLTRLINAMHKYAALSFSQLWKQVLRSQTPGVLIYYWLIGQLFGYHLSEKMLPCISAFISFIFLFALFKEILKDGSAKTRDVAAILLLFMTRGLFMGAISNIRTIMSLSLIAWCVYREMVKNKSFWSNIVFYIAAVSMHALGQFIFLIRIAFMFIEKGKKVSDKAKRILLAIGMITIIVLFCSNYLNLLQNKISNYIQSSMDGTGYFYIWEEILTIMAVLVTVYLLLLNRKFRIRAMKSGTTRNSGYDKLIRFIYVVVLIDVVSAFIEFNAFARIGVFLFILDIPLGIHVLTEARRYGANYSIREKLFLISIVMLLITSSRGELCSLKFFQ